MCNLPQSIVDVLDRVPMRELEEYLDDRKIKQVAPVKREPRAANSRGIAKAELTIACAR